MKILKRLLQAGALLCVLIPAHAEVRCSPIVIDLGNDGIKLGERGVGVYFDINADGVRDRMQWTRAGGDEGFLALAEGFPKVRFDTTMAFTDFFEEMAPFPPGLRPRLRELGLRGKVLLGSDFPTIPYAYAHQLDALARLELGDSWLRAVCWENACDLFGMTPRG